MIFEMEIYAFKDTAFQLKTYIHLIICILICMIYLYETINQSLILYIIYVHFLIVSYESMHYLIVSNAWINEMFENKKIHKTVDHIHICIYV